MKQHAARELPRTASEVAETERSYWAQRKEMLDRIRNREPIFRLEEVTNVQAMIAKKREEHKAMLRELEHQQWERLEQINRNVLTRPLLME